MNVSGDVACCHAKLPTKCLTQKRHTTLWDGGIGLPFPHPINTCNATHASYHIYTSHRKKNVYTYGVMLLPNCGQTGGFTIPLLHASSQGHKTLMKIQKIV